MQAEAVAETIAARGQCADQGGAGAGMHMDMGNAGLCAFAGQFLGGRRTDEDVFDKAKARASGLADEVTPWQAWQNSQKSERVCAGEVGCAVYRLG